MNTYNNTRECIEERHGIFFDPDVPEPTEEELLIAKQLAEDAYKQRGLIVTLADLGIRVELTTESGVSISFDLNS